MVAGMVANSFENLATSKSSRLMVSDTTVSKAERLRIIGLAQCVYAELCVGRVVVGLWKVSCQVGSSTSKLPSFLSSWTFIAIHWQRLFLQDDDISIWMSWIFSFRIGSCFPVR